MRKSKSNSAMRNDALTFSNELVLCESSLGKEQEKTRRSNDALPAINMTEIKMKYEYRLYSEFLTQ
jgi:hypothetical protein